MSDTARSICVVKVGGSLLSLENLPSILLAWLGLSTGPRAVIVGGGSLVDELRLLTDRFATPARESHFLAIRTMSIAARALAPSLDNAPVCRLEEAHAAWASGRSVVVIDPAMDAERDEGKTLPVGWHVTSDSIAAWFAQQLKARKLVLLKSVGDDEAVHVGEATRMDWIDDYFPTALSDLADIDCAVTWVNLRREPWKEVKVVW